MITLITGIPGMGKTSLLVTMLLELEKEADRPLFVMGIPDLTLEHVVCPPVAEWTEYRQSPEDPTLKLAYFTFPPNSILVVDEAQRVFRPRASASKVPPEVAALETHRHTGLDIILLTQKPKLIDTNVRELVGRHIHIRAGMLGRYLYEWPHIADGESRLDRSDAAKRRFKPPKQSFKHYKSAEIHTKHKFRRHQIFLVAAVAFAFLGWQGYSAYNIFNRNLHPETAQAKSQSAGMTTRPGAVASPAVATQSTEFTLKKLLPTSMTLAEATTRIDDSDPYSAPLYADKQPPVVAPEIIGCVHSAKTCTCYTQQATQIFVPPDQCIARSEGKYYDPYHQPEQAHVAAKIPKPASNPAPLPVDAAVPVSEPV